MKYLFVFLILLPFAMSGQVRDSRVREYLPPERIVWMQDAHLVSGVGNLLAAGTGQADLSNGNVARIKTSESDHPALLLDFGRELHGGLQIVTGFSSKKEITVRIRLGESASEAMSDVGEESGATNDHAMRDYTIKLPWLGNLEIGNSGFRFARIDVLDDNVELQLKEVRAISVFRDIPYKGSFRCSDERLDRIWETGAYTVHLNMQEYLWDGIKRDRLVWIGDMYPEVMTINAVFGYNEVVPKTLDFAREITPLPAWMNGFSSYSISWLMIHYDWFRHNGNLEYLNDNKEYITGLLRQLISHIGPDGVERLDGIRFLDWPSSENKAAVDAGLQAFCILAMKAGKEMCIALGENVLASECEDAERRLVSASAIACKDFSASSLSHDAPGQKQSAALMALSGLMDIKSADEKYISYNGSRGFSTFFGFFMLEAMALAGNYAGAMDIIKEYWGAMIDLGATTFWEDFNIDWIENAAPITEPVPDGKTDVHGSYGAYCYKKFRHSLCHGWASGPTYWLSRHVLGIYPAEPGFKKVIISPNLGNLDWAEGSYPTPYGEIKVRHEKRRNGSVKSVIDLPEGVKLVERE